MDTVRVLQAPFGECCRIVGEIGWLAISSGNSSGKWRFFAFFLPLPRHATVDYQRFTTLAPEVGLEPTTTRLTAACSTIELLWNANGRVIYKPRTPAVNFIRQDFWQCGQKKVLRAACTIRLTGVLAIPTRLAGAVINAQPFRVKIRRCRRRCHNKTARLIHGR